MLRRRGGFTLLELLVYTTLLSASLSAVYGILIAIMDYSRVSQATIDVQNNAQKGLSALYSELIDSKATTVTSYTSPSGIIFLSARNGNDGHDVDSGGNLEWYRWVCYYLDSTTQQLMRKDALFAGAPSTIIPANPYTTASFALMSGGRVVAQNVSSFVVSGSGPFMVTIGVGQTVFSNAAQTMDNTIYMVDEVACRN